MSYPFYTNRRKGSRYHIEKQLEDFETLEEAEEESKYRQKVMLKSDSVVDISIAEMLHECTEECLCNSAACPSCFRKFRQCAFSETVHLIKRYSTQVMVTAIHYSNMMTDDEVKSFEPSKMHNLLRSRLNRAGINTPVIGYLELDYHQEQEMWLPHYHLMFLSDESIDLEPLRKVYLKKEKRFNSTSKVDRPLQVKPLKDHADQISYLFKSYAMMIVPYLKDGKRRTRKIRLPDEQLQLSLRYFNRAWFTGSLFLYKIRREGRELVF